MTVIRFYVILFMVEKMVNLLLFPKAARKVLKKGFSYHFKHSFLKEGISIFININVAKNKRRVLWVN